MISGQFVTSKSKKKSEKCLKMRRNACFCLGVEGLNLLPNFLKGEGGGAWQELSF